jgi:hypothetical protein
MSVLLSAAPASWLIGHIDGTTIVAPTNGPWLADYYTVLNHLHSAIDEDVADMVLASNQTVRQLWLANLRALLRQQGEQGDLPRQ